MFIDVVIAVLCGLLILLGIAGSVLPVIPGPPLAWLGLLLLNLSKFAGFTTLFLVVMAAVMVLITVLDFIIPAWGTKKFGGSKAGATGSVAGLIVGLFFGLPGIVFGPFVGAFVGEYLTNSGRFKEALKSATGSFMGFLIGTGLKLIYGGVCAYYFMKMVFF